MFLCRKMTTNNLQQIAEAICVQNHTTIMHGIKKIEQDYAANNETRDTIDLLKKKINPPS
jgi:chromosomal replication initiator protein